MEYHGTGGNVTVFSKSHFFSLKWKALLLTSLVLVAVTMAISLRSYINLNAQFDKHRRDAQERYSRNIEALTNQSLNRLRQLGSMIPSLPGMQRSLASGDLQSIRQSFDPQWPVLQFDLGIDVLGFYDSANRPLASWEINDWHQRNSAQVLDGIKQVNEREVPVMALTCNPDCMQYAIVPILVGGRGAGALLVGSSLADVMRSFQQISGSDIGLIVAGADGIAADDQGRWISEWNTRVVALTNFEHNLRVLKQAAAGTPLAAAVAGLRNVLDGFSYEISLVPLPEFVGGDPAYLAIITDVTGTLREIRQATEEIVIVGGTGWLLSQLLLLAILWIPMSRLRLTARSLPLLAQSEFDEARTVIASQARQHYLQDEIDILDDTAIALANRLERLEQEVVEHTRSLSQRMADLSQERDFVASLLNTAQVMIVTQDRQGRILMANPFACCLTGFEEVEMSGRDFVELLLPQDRSDMAGKRLKEELASQRHEHLRHESLVTCKDGSIRNITWYHSRLHGQTEDGPFVLSVGLDITERRGAESRLAWLADHDILTGLLNRRRFQEELELALAATQRQNRTGALLLIDLDQFKYINDTCGHHSGDTLLKLVANALTADIKAADVVARLGSDEFALLIREADPAGAVDIAKKVHTAVNGISHIVGGQRLRITASIGIVLFPRHADNVGDLLASADLAMYQAKDNGRGHWQMFSENDEIRERMRDRVYWRDKVSAALAEDRFVLYFQPIMKIDSGRISHYEVLLRMRDEDGSIIGPARFIDTAERGGMIHDVDRMVISKAIRLLAALNRGGHNVTFSINLSGHAFSDSQLLPHLRHELERSRVDNSKIIFEITETAAVTDFAVANGMILAIKELGCRFALDDFGIGFSSFYYLKRLPVDYLKIDGSFIRQLSDSLDDQLIVRAMSQVAAGFGKQTIAEYVETQATLDLLRDYGIDFAQGYLISEPRSEEETFYRVLLKQNLSP